MIKISQLIDQNTRIIIFYSHSFWILLDLSEFQGGPWPLLDFFLVWIIVYECSNIVYQTQRQTECSTLETMEGNRPVQWSLIKYCCQWAHDEDKVIVLKKCERLPNLVSWGNKFITISQDWRVIVAVMITACISHWHHCLPRDKMARLVRRHPMWLSQQGGTEEPETNVSAS